MNSEKPLHINMVLMLVSIILILILIGVIVVDMNKKPIQQNNIIFNNTINENKHNGITTNIINTTSNTTTIPNNESSEVAMIGDMTFESIQEAIDYVGQGASTTPRITSTPSTTATNSTTTNTIPNTTATPSETNSTVIKLLRDVTSIFTVGANKDIVIDMDNHTITSAGDKAIATIDGKVELRNGKVVAKYTKPQLYAVKVNQTGNLKCTNIDFDLSTSEGGWIISSEGTLSLDSAKLNYQKGTAINNVGTIEDISGDTLLESNGNYIALYNVGTINKITSGKVISNGYAIFNSGTIEEIVGDTEVTSKQSYAIYNSGNIDTIKDTVSISSSAEKVATIYNNGGTINKITGRVNINAEKNRAIYNMGVINEISGSVTVNSDGDSSVSTIYNSNPGELTITGGTITKNNGGYGVYREGGTVTITGGSISSKYNC